VPVNDHLLGVVADCPPAQHLVVTMGTNGLVVDLTLALVAAEVRPPSAPSCRWPAAAERSEPGEAPDGLGRRGCWSSDW
jgi:hypothetical protein